MRIPLAVTAFFALLYVPAAGAGVPVLGIFANDGARYVRAYDARTLRALAPRHVLEDAEPLRQVRPWARSPDGWSLATVVYDRGFRIVDTRSGTDREVPSACCPSAVSWPAPDRLIVGAGYAIETIDPRVPEIVRVEPANAPPAWDLGAAAQRGNALFVGLSPGLPLYVLESDGDAVRNITVRRLWGGGPFTGADARDAARRATDDLAQRLAISPAQVIPVSVTWETWPTIFGCSGATAVDYGFRVVLSAENRTYDYRVHDQGSPFSNELVLCTRPSPPADPLANLLTATNVSFVSDVRAAFDPAGRVYLISRNAPVAVVNVVTGSVHYLGPLRLPELTRTKVQWVAGTTIAIGTQPNRISDVRTGRQRFLDRRLDFVVSSHRVLTFGGYRGVYAYGSTGKRVFVLLRHRYVDLVAAQGRYAYFHLYQSHRWCVVDVPRASVLACRALPTNVQLLTGRSGVLEESP